MSQFQQTHKVKSYAFHKVAVILFRYAAEIHNRLTATSRDVCVPNIASSKQAVTNSMWVIPSGTSADMDRQTCGESGVALVKKLRYRSANVNTTGSCISIVTASSSLSTLALCASFMLPSHSNHQPDFIHLADRRRVSNKPADMISRRHYYHNPIEFAVFLNH